MGEPLYNNIKVLCDSNSRSLCADNVHEHLALALTVMVQSIYQLELSIMEAIAVVSAHAQ